MQAGGDGETFLAYDVSRPRPIAHDTGEPLFLPRAGGGVFNGEATLQEIVDSRTVVVSGLPANFQLSAGDYLEVRQSILVRSLHRIMADVTANGSGVVTLSQVLARYRNFHDRSHNRFRETFLPHAD
jgi:hypothetical protein